MTEPDIEVQVSCSTKLFDLAKLFPVVFMLTENGVKIALIFSLKKMIPCVYQDAGTKKCTIWDSVRPSACKSYPFAREIKITSGSKVKFKISIDRSCEGVKESPAGIQIFTEDCKISAEILGNFFGHEVLGDHVKNLHATNKFLKLVNELDLLVSEEIVIGKKALPAGNFKNITIEVLKADERKLAALDLDSMKRLQASGYLNAIDLHLKSLANFPKLVRAMTEFENTMPAVNMLDFTFGS